MKKLLKKIFPWWFTDWDKEAADRVKKMNELFYKVVERRRDQI
jgi:hypothetical protein